MNTVKYYVPDISCNHCVHTIKTELIEMEGVKGVEVDLETKMVMVIYDSPATPEKIEALLAEINYPVER